MTSALLQPETLTPAVPPDNQAAALQSRPDHAYLWNQAQAMAKSQLIPAHFRGKPGDCFIMADVAERLGTSLLATLQATYVVHGKPGFEGKFVAGLLEGSGKIIGPIDYAFSGDGDEYGCQAIVQDAFLRKEVRGPRVTWKMVKAEGWNKNKGSEVSKWNTLPDLMFHYRAATFLVRTRYPSVLMGMNTREELDDITVDCRSEAVERLKVQARQQRLEQEPPEAPPEPPEQQPAVDAPEPAETQEAPAVNEDAPPWPFAGVDLSKWGDDIPPAWRKRIAAAMDVDAISHVRGAAQADKTKLTAKAQSAIVAACDRIIRAETG